MNSMTATQELTEHLATLPETEREKRARQWLVESRARSERDAIIAAIPVERGTHQPRNDQELTALLDDARDSLDRGEGIDFDELDLVGDFKRRHGLTEQATAP